MSATIVAFREARWLDYKTEFRIWKQLVRAYQVEFKLIDSVEELPIGDFATVVLDEKGSTPLERFNHPGSCLYVFGCTHQNDLMDLPHDESVVISYPGHHSLFGMQAAAIVLEDRKRKHGSYN